MIIPASLKQGDKIAILTPASVVKEEYIDHAADFISSLGFVPVVMAHAKGPADGSYSARVEDRLSDFLTAFQDRDIKCIVCGRGGYGAAHLLPHIPGDLLRNNQKWLIGFSDISALHALSLSQGVMSVHGPMCRHFTPSDEGVSQIFDILEGAGTLEYNLPVISSEKIPENREGRGEGILIGGNVAVLNGLAATPFDMFAKALTQDCILFIEDIAEPIYKIERVLYRLYMQGVLSKIKGLVVGKFTEYKSSRDHSSMERMIADFLTTNKLDSFPVAYDFPAGHIEGNMPLVMGAPTILEITPDTVNLRQNLPF